MKKKIATVLMVTMFATSVPVFAGEEGNNRGTDVSVSAQVYNLNAGITLNDIKYTSSETDWRIYNSFIDHLFSGFIFKDLTKDEMKRFVASNFVFKGKTLKELKAHEKKAEWLFKQLELIIKERFYDSKMKVTPGSIEAKELEKDERNQKKRLQLLKQYTSSYFKRVKSDLIKKAKQSKIKAKGK
ncbi:hypothetical protein [Carboxydocella sp. JDF658]|uniref:hypothetical protein n=1 Tax=Carboxydocella sp. JDF658 TaxID=1926600 RepID=UPI0009ADF746|nr:hypothetical protein [Carboxydocella sp. JDF658]GAW30613.1 hypothetical protein JDF658_03780 [Carboxydocella sp. JDF658]